MQLYCCMVPAGPCVGDHAITIPAQPPSGSVEVSFERHATAVLLLLSLFCLSSWPAAPPTPHCPSQEVVLHTMQQSTSPYDPSSVNSPAAASASRLLYQLQHPSPSTHTQTKQQQRKKRAQLTLKAPWGPFQLMLSLQTPSIQNP